MLRNRLPVQLRPLLLSTLCWLVGSACRPEALDETGKLCSTERACGTGYFCVRGSCSTTLTDADVDGGALPGNSCSGRPCPLVNLLINGDFEAGAPPSAWTVLFGTLEADRLSAKSGLQSAAIQPTPWRPPGIDGGNVYPVEGWTRLTPSNALVEAHPGEQYCASVWVKGAKAADGFASLSLSSSQQDTPELVRLSEDWTALHASYRVQTAESLSFVLTLSGSETLYVDDARAWRAPNGSCQ
jgi:hypothetical protein